MLEHTISSAAVEEFLATLAAGREYVLIITLTHVTHCPRSAVLNHVIIIADWIVA